MMGHQPQVQEKLFYTRINLGEARCQSLNCELMFDN